MKDNLTGKFFIHNLTFYKGQQKYGNNYFTNYKEFLELCPFKLLTKVEIKDFECDEYQTSSIFLTRKNFLNSDNTKYRNNLISFLESVDCKLVGNLIKFVKY